MKRFLVVVLLAVLGVQAVVPAEAARRVVVRRGPHRRTIVIVHRGWPLRRPMRTVVVHPVRTQVRVTSVRYVAPVVFTGVVVAVATAPARDRFVWEDGETLARDEDWTEFTLNCNTRGKALWLEIPSGRVQFDWAEVVFENGDTQVVDFAERTHPQGLYSLLDFRNGRMVDHVRVLARAKSDAASVVLRMQKD